MNRQQIAQIYDGFPENQRDMPREQFIKKAMAALDPNKMMQEADVIAQGRIQRKQIDAVLGRQG